jgi:hypothetical protein
MAEKMLLDADRVIAKMGQWNKEDGERASSAASTREDIGQFVEATGYHKKALSDGRKLMKMHERSPEKFEDYLRTFEPLFEDIKNHCRGQSTPDMFDDAGDEPLEPADDDDLAPTGHDELDQDTADFEQALADAAE